MVNKIISAMLFMSIFLIAIASSLAVDESLCYYDELYSSDETQLIYLNYTIYEDAQDENTLGWQIYDNTPVGAEILNVYNPKINSRVIEFAGKNKNGYKLLLEDGSSWNNKELKYVSWEQNFTSNFMIAFLVNTTNGQKLVSYVPKNSPPVIIWDNTTVRISLGLDAKNGTWQTFSRNLEEDLKSVFPNLDIISVEEFRVVGKGMIDNVKLFNSVVCGAQKEIGPEGGIIEIQDENSPILGVRVEIPQEALDENVLITIKESYLDEELPEGFEKVSPVIDFGPEGLSFDNNVIVEIPIINVDLVGDEELRLLHFSDGNVNPEIIVPFYFDDLVVKFYIEHFSKSVVTKTVINETKFLKFPLVPMDDFKVVSGWYRNNGNPHNGIDYLPKDDSIEYNVYSGSSGEITRIVNNRENILNNYINLDKCITADRGEAYGNRIQVLYTTKTGRKYEVLYAHLKNNTINKNLSVGDAIEEGEFLGVMGNTGCSNGKHLHLEVRKNADYLNKIDPYDIYNVSLEYPSSENNYSKECGKHYLWTQCPPVEVDLEGNQETPKLLLKKNISLCVSSYPVLGDNGIIYTSASPNCQSGGTGVVAIDPTNMSVLWGPIIPSQCVGKHPVSDAFGPVSVDSNNVLYGVGDWNECRDGWLVAFNGSNGNIIWERGTASEGYSPHPREIPAINEELNSVYFGSSYLFSVKMDTGVSNWYRSGGNYIGTGIVAIDTLDNIYYGSYAALAVKLRTYTSDGVFRWGRVSYPTLYIRAIMSDNTLLIWDDTNKRLIESDINGNTLLEINANMDQVVTDVNDNIYGRDLNDNSVVSFTREGSLRYRTIMDKPITRVSFLDSSSNLYVVANDTLYCVRDNGDILWNYTTDNKIFSNPILIRGGNIFLSDKGDLVYVLDTNIDYANSSWPMSYYGNRRNTQKVNEALPLKESNLLN